MIICKFINFAIFLAIVFFAARTPLKRWWNQRRDETESAINKIARLYKATSDEHEKWLKAVERIDDDVLKMIGDYKKEGDLERFKIVDLANKYANKIRNDAAMAARHEMDVAIHEMRKWAAKEAVNAAKYKLTKEISPAERSEFLVSAAEEIEGSL